MSKRPAHIEGSKQVGHCECDTNTVIGTHHMQAIVTVAERKTGYTVMVEVLSKTADLVRPGDHQRAHTLRGQGQDADLLQRQRIL